ncbi:acyltransferase family protein [Nonomuraea turcica]|uniref:acyltransferase family protein n=1 Tax=Nonomuraea sp. G32 TaxID=3067274 RepID=UPI00273CCC2F|nr:acyltransferase [Nonomuraea sp. G32]MDP4502847.1 acyltransferase [Nonomuraea sp. G32]
MRTRSDRLYEIDGLRLLAALCVVVFHYTFSGWVGGASPVAFPEESSWSKYGYLGVDLFFLISGFVVLMSAWGRSPRAFLVSRAVRLYPAYWVGIAVTATVAVTLGQGMFQVTLPQVLANLTMFQAVPDIANVDVVYWTLWAEMRFYLLILVFAWIGMTRARVMAGLWIWLGLTFGVQLGLVPGVADLVVQSEFAHYFIAGMALFMLYKFGLNLQIALLVPICLGNAVYRAIGYADAVGDRYSVTYSTAIITTVVVVIFLVMTLVALRVTQRLGRPWLVPAGALTYPLYLLHAHIGFIVFARLGDAVDAHVLLCGLILVMLGAAYLVHRFVERPLAPALKRLLSRRPVAPALGVLVAGQPTR